MSNAVKKENSALELVKSVAVIPVVVAIVLGLGWSLVRWAHARQVDSGKPDPRPAKVNADGSIELEIPFAQVTGEIHLGGGRRGHLGNWKRMGETVAWKFELDKPGRYAVELECACDAANAGSVVRVETDGDSLEITVPDTGGPNTFKTVRAGEIEFSSTGWRELRIVPLTIAHTAVMTLRGVRLVPKAS
ncbi:MAG TPA: carbohydrate-binding domain-containing protein [Planctomycetaceae bacterium]|nr:carbohydrate-binding domain-containing protein [Planctomycetaceae bacterium]